MESVGQSIKRVDAYEKGSGRTRYVADLPLPGLLHGATLRSPLPRARIEKIDLSRAAALPGVKAVLLAGDVPGRNQVTLILNDMPLLAAGEVNYVGEPVALVAATTEEAARAAVRSIVVEYEPLPPLADVEQSRRDGAPLLFEPQNTFATHRLNRGDVDTGRSQSVATVKGTFTTPCQEHAYIETQGMLATPAQGGGIDVVGSMQCPFYVQSALAAVLGLPQSKVIVRQAPTGGAFGGKEDVPSIVACHAALLAVVTGSAVRLLYRRDEDIICMSKRHRSRITLEIGCDAQGNLTFVTGEVLLDGGAYATLSPVVLWRSVIHAAGAYACPNVAIVGHAAATNTVPAGAFRGFGSPQSLFAVESLIDELALETGRDPAEMRRINILREGRKTTAGQLIDHSCGLEETLDRTLEACDWTRKKEEFRRERGPVRRGLGISTIFYGVGLGAGGKHMAKTNAFLQIAGDASIQIAVGTTELGQGMRTVLAQIVSEALGLPLDRIAWLDTDTSRVPDSGPTVASRATTMSGNALLDACRQARETILSCAATLMPGDAAPQTLCIERGSVRAAGKEHAIPLDEVIAACHREKYRMAFHGFSSVQGTSWNPEKGSGDPYVVYAYATNAVQVQVDSRTGETRVEEIWAAHDVGAAVNPQSVEGQIEGGTLQGLGYALTEDFAIHEGRPLNPDLATYIIPCSTDTPRIHSIIVESAYRDGPFGAKGFGEQPLMGVAPAVLNAIRDALGVRINSLPAVPERVWQAICEANGPPTRVEPGSEVER